MQGETLEQDVTEVYGKEKLKDEYKPKSISSKGIIQEV